MTLLTLLTPTITLEDLQSWVAELYSCAQIFTPIAGLLAILLPILRTFACYHRFTDAVSGLVEVAWQQVAWFLTSWSSSSSSSGTFASSAATVCLDSPDPSALYVSGLVNTGNSCFLNSCLQALSSLPCLHTYLNDHPVADQGPVTGSLLKTIRQLSKPLKRHASFRPRDIVASLLSKHVIINREQQDAQELFQLIVGALDAEAAGRIAAMMLGGLKFLTQFKTQQQFMLQNTTTPFTGLLASRLSCMCGYTYTTTLDACLRQFTAIEYLNDAACRKCSLTNTLRTLKEQSALKPNSKKKNKKTKMLLDEIESRLKANRIEDEIAGVERTVSPLSTKQVMFAKPPKILCLHLSRSAFHASGAVYKNACQILFPEYLDLAHYTTTGTLCTQPNVPISSPADEEENGITSSSNTQYRLMSTIVHYGSHSYGHFVAFKRRILARQCRCPNCCDDKEGHESWEGSSDDAWYRISDSKVDLCTFDVVQQANPYMLLYELMEHGSQEKGQGVEEDESDEDKDNIDDLMVAATTSTAASASSNNADSPTDIKKMPYTSYCSSQDAEEALRIANSLLMDDRNDNHDTASRWSEGAPLISIP
ncbi:hypothetical protein BDB00DRAFT_766603 [Zychaea mexicana]|uniref:uncharacterized protein n=1 Tax=Zychaea mexicana TaxID=64656 RepID=UPI0022FECB5A|nr:uncharacterized protein BDB00DRAFT_766603 [Zychaea mexicana]KAI9491722.1 hypothetical protein BDB00DRAFT_766603 [Zychaea mexicana]